MNIDKKTKIDDLLNRYPFLEDYLPTLSNKYAMLKNKVMRKTVGRLADLEHAAEIGGFGTEDLIKKILARIGEEGGKATAGGDEGAKRRDAIKDVIRKLHDGADPDSLKAEFSSILENLGAHELSRVEQELIDGGMPVTEVQRMCNLHASLFKEGLERQSIPGVPDGHPVQVMLKENRELEKRTAAILEAPSAPDIKEKLADLRTIETHYVRKENQLFPLLEKHDITGPSKVMWGKHDEIRALFKKAESGNPPAEETVNALILEITGMITKEEQILIPMALEVLSDEEWKQVQDGEQELGYCWISPPAQWAPEPGTGDSAAGQSSGNIDLSVGRMSPELLNLMLCHLPVELSLVDENDRVLYYSKTKERIFPRTPAVIGRKVQNCHPQSSVDVVNRILDAFRKGEKDSAEFWLKIKGADINIRYFAVRDAENRYRGCLEVTQDISHIRSLEGERRILDWK